MIVTAGELLSEFVSHHKDCALERPSVYSGPYPSGAPGIFIDQAALVGAEAHMIGQVGNDPFGRSIKTRLEADGVDISRVSVNETMPTGIAIVSYFSDGGRIFAFYIKNTAAEHLDTIPLPERDMIFHVSGASLSIGGVRPAIMEMARAVKAQGGKISYDPNIRPELMDDNAIFEAVNELISISDILLPSEADLEVLFPDTNPDAKCRALVAGDVDVLVYKMGSKGVKVYSKDENFDLAPHQVEEVDATGAGDCFCGAFIGLVDQGYSLREAAQYANAAGALHVTKRGPMEFNPSFDEIKHFLNQQG